MAKSVTLTVRSNNFRKLSQLLGQGIAQLLHDMQWSGQDLADALGTTRQYVSQVLNGGSCSFKTVMNICDAMGLELVIILRRKETGNEATEGKG